MSLRRSISLALGLVTVATGFAVALRPGLASGLDASEIVVTMLGLAGITYAIYALAGRRRSEQRYADDPVPEAVPTGERPGDDLDRLLERAAGVGPGSAGYRRRLRRRLEAAAVEAVRRHEGCTEAEARHRLDDGTWTDDPTAASYFAGGDVSVDREELSLRDSVRVRLSRAHRHGHVARRTVAAIAALTGVEEPPEDG